jgi:hypothetical protein
MRRVCSLIWPSSRSGSGHNWSLLVDALARRSCCGARGGKCGSDAGLQLASHLAGQRVATNGNPRGGPERLAKHGAALHCSRGRFPGLVEALPAVRPLCLSLRGGLGPVRRDGACHADGPGVLCTERVGAQSTLDDSPRATGTSLTTELHEEHSVFLFRAAGLFG